MSVSRWIAKYPVAVGDPPQTLRGSPAPSPDLEKLSCGTLLFSLLSGWSNLLCGPGRGGGGYIRKGRGEGGLSIPATEDLVDAVYCCLIAINSNGAESYAYELLAKIGQYISCKQID